MSRQSVKLIGATAGLGVVIAVIMASVASAAPAGVGGLTPRVEMVTTIAPGGDITALEPTCEPDEIRTGGGYQVGSIGFADKVFVNAPLGERAWLVEIFVDGPASHEVQLWAFAVCLSHGGGR